jgi:hypothetical protein
MADPHATQAADGVGALSGRLSVELVIDEHRVAQVVVRSSRPQLAARLLHGQPAALAIDAVPRLYSLCAGAHAVAAQRAVQAALGENASDAQTAAGTRRLALETARETLWRVLIDWPQALGQAPEAAPLAALRAAQLTASPEVGVAAMRTIVEQHVLGERADRWSARHDPADFGAWSAAGSTSAARFVALLAQEAAGRADRAATAVTSATAFLPSLADPAVAAAIAASLRGDVAFARAPLWRGAPAETGALARLQADPRIAAMLVTEGVSPHARWSARLIELARIAAGASAPHAMHGALRLPADGGRRCGLGWAESARGVLVHYVEIDGTASARVLDYRVLAPTEWNFHPRGALAVTLAGRRAGSLQALRREAQRLIDALDPCVACVLQLHEEAVIA